MYLDEERFRYGYALPGQPRQRNGLKHYVFFERLAETKDNTVEAADTSAGLLALRHLDHYYLAGPEIIVRDGIEQRSTRAEAAKIPAGDPLRTALIDFLDRIVAIPRDGLAPVFPDMFPIAEAYERRHLPKLAADVYWTISCYADDETLVVNARRKIKEIEAGLG